jgi:hypothetical protein
MMTTERLLEAVRRLPEPLALELLDFAEYLAHKHQAHGDREYAEAQRQALSLMGSGLDLGGEGIWSREALHER